MGGENIPIFFASSEMWSLRAQELDDERRGESQDADLLRILSLGTDAVYRGIKSYPVI